MRKYTWLIFIYLFVFNIFMATAFADNAVQQDENFDFTSIKTVYVEPEIDFANGIKLSDLDSMKVEKSFAENKQYLKNVQFTEDKQVADAVIKIGITGWGNNTYWRAPETYIDYRTVAHVDSRGNVYTTVIPFARTRPGYYYGVEYFEATYTVTDRAGNMIYKRADRREDTKDAYAMFGRATKAFYKDFSGLINDKQK